MVFQSQTLRRSLLPPVPKTRKHGKQYSIFICDRPVALSLLSYHKHWRIMNEWGLTSKRGKQSKATDANGEETATPSVTEPSAKKRKRVSPKTTAKSTTVVVDIEDDVEEVVTPVKKVKSKANGDGPKIEVKDEDWVQSWPLWWLMPNDSCYMLRGRGTRLKIAADTPQRFMPVVKAVFSEPNGLMRILQYNSHGALIIGDTFTWLMMYNRLDWNTNAFQRFKMKQSTKSICFAKHDVVSDISRLNPELKLFFPCSSIFVIQVEYEQSCS